MLNNVVQKIVFSGLLLASNMVWADLSNAPSGNYALDKTHAYILASYTHLGFSNPSIAWRSFDVSLQLDSANVANSKLAVTVDANSVDSGVEVFDDHLKGGNFFDTENHPELTFVASKIESDGGDNYTIMGDLTMKGITKPVTLNATINKADVHPMRRVPTLGISASGQLLRSEWDMGRGAPATTDEVTLKIDVELPQQVPGGGMGMGMGMGG